MAYNVTSWFVEQIEAKNAKPKRVFTIGGSDYSGFVNKWPTIRRKWDEVRPQSITMELANEGQSFDFIRADKTKLRSSCAVQLGFTHPTSGDELITLYSGTMDKVRYANGACSITLLDKFKQLSERIMGTRDTPVAFTDSSTPPDIAWAAVTSYGGYSAVASDSNPDIDYASFLEWSSVLSADAVFMNGLIDGSKCTEVLKKISRFTQSAIAIENDRIFFKRFSLADSNSGAFTNDNVIDVTLSIDDEDIVNKQYVSAGYVPSSNAWAIQVFDVVSSSVESYGLREQVEKDESVWFVNSNSALNLAQRLTSTAGEPFDRVNVITPLAGALRQVGETMTLVDSTHSIDDGFRVMAYTIDMDRSVFKAEIDRSQYAQPFTLDVSYLDGSDVLA